MKTIQTFALLILLFTAKTYSQEDVALEIDGGSITTETVSPEALPAIPDDKVEPVGEAVSSSLAPEEPPRAQDIEVTSSDSPPKEEEIPATIGEIQESSSIASESEPSQPKEEETPATIGEIQESSSIATESEPSQPKEEETPATIGEIQESSSTAIESEPSTESPEETPQTIDEATTLSESKPELSESTSEPSPPKEEETQATIGEIQESSSIAIESEPSTESPDETPQTVDEATTLSESEPEVSESTSGQQPLETITCVCNCGVDSDLPQICEDEATPKNDENAPPVESTDEPLAPEIEKEAEAENSVTIATNSPSDGETSPSETDNSIVNEETSEPIATEKETVAAENIENPETTATSNLPQEEADTTAASNSPQEAAEPTENTDSTPETEESLLTEAPLTSTDTEPELNVETSSNLPDSSTDSTSELELSAITDEPLEVSSTTTPTPCTEIGDTSNPTDCRKYVSCSGNDTNLLSQELQCPERSAFNPLLGRCTRDLSPCVNEEPICLQASSIANPNGENSSYFWCVPSLLGGFHKYHIQCSQNEVFVPLLGRCWIDISQIGLGLGLIIPEPSDRDLVRAEWKLLRREMKLKAKEERLRKKLEEKARARAEKLAAKELKKQKGGVRKVDDESVEDDD